MPAHHSDRLSWCPTAADYYWLIPGAGPSLVADYYWLIPPALRRRRIAGYFFSARMSSEAANEAEKNTLLGAQQGIFVNERAAKQRTSSRKYPAIRVFSIFSMISHHLVQHPYIYMGYPY